MIYSSVRQKHFKKNQHLSEEYLVEGLVNVFLATRSNRTTGAACCSAGSAAVALMKAKEITDTSCRFEMKRKTLISYKCRVDASSSVGAAQQLH